MIVITAPTGNIGHRVVDTVLAAGEPVRVIAREPARLSAGVRERAEVVQGSHGDARVVAQAFDGADAVFWLLPSDPRAAGAEEAFLGFTRPAAEAMRGLGVERVVDVSALGRGTPQAGRAGHVTASLAMDDLIAGTGVAFRALAASGFMENLLRQVRTIKEQGLFFDVLSPDRELRVVATRDIAAVGARLLLDPTWTGQEEIPLLGPENLSYDAMAAVVSEVLGTSVQYKQISVQALADRLTAQGMSGPMVQSMLDMMAAKEDGLDDAIVRTPRHAIDTPTTFRQWCEEVLKPAVRG